MGLIKGVVGLDNVKDCDLIIEAVFENHGGQEGSVQALDKIAKPGAMLASNTSYLNIDEIAAGRPAVRRMCSACTSSRRRTS